MSTVSQIFKGDLSDDFNPGGVIPNKYTLNIDGTTLIRNANGTLSSTVVSSGTKLARLNIGSGTITNTGSPQNLLSGISLDWDDIGVSVTTDAIKFPEGTFRIEYIFNTADNNSARVAHRTSFSITGSVIEGNNYMRDATAHDTSHLYHVDVFKALGGEVAQLNIQTTSSTLNTTNITGGYIIITKY